ncbi:hypothetical protein [Halobacteriovorax sp. CON-3]|uniref:hypothetical protein n=1 Tax=Halobacteriovorax sp. CON-3 TaxID=3157710 RepID=UPI0037226714
MKSLKGDKLGVEINSIQVLSTKITKKSRGEYSCFKGCLISIGDTFLRIRSLSGGCMSPDVYIDLGLCSKCLEKVKTIVVDVDLIDIDDLIKI